MVLNIQFIKGDGVFRHNSKFNSKDHDVPTLDSFYVRLSGLNLFYTETEEDLIVLGTIALKNI
jgi:hypothetical protein